jgi:hypothetical protein
MSQISLAESSDLFQKLFAENVRLATFFITPSRVRVRLDGFLTGADREKGIFITTHPLPDGGGDWINVSPFNKGECVFSYGEAREVPDELRKGILGESALMIDSLTTGERLAIFFTL